MNDVTKSVDVHVPLRTAYNQWTDVESFPHFMSGVIAVRRVDDRHTHWVTEVGGARREFDAEIVEQLPDERIAWRSVDGDVRHGGVVTFEPISDRETRVTVDLAWEPGGLLEKAGGAVGLDRLQIQADLDRFRQYVEEKSPGDGTVPATPATPNSPDTPATHDDVVAVLVSQHAQLKDLMARTSNAEGDEKHRLFSEVVRELRSHELGEQRVVHPVTRSCIENGERTAADRLGEEERADQLIAEAEVANVTADSEEFDAWFERLRKAVLNHAEHEEREEFPKLRQELSPARLHAMADDLVAVQTAANLG